MVEDKKYYWLKLKKDFFKRHDIRIIEGMPNGKEYVLFYLKLMLESVDHKGELRFNETIPYDENMLSVITSTNIDIVRSAMKLLINLELVELLEDRTIFMTEVDKLLGAETYWAEKKRQKRDKKAIALENVQQLSNDCPTCPSKSLDIEIDIEKEIDKDKNPPYINELEKVETDLFKLVEKEFGRPLSSTEIDKISYWLKTVGEAYFTHAFREALMYQKLNITYIDRILVTWQKKEYTLDQLNNGIQNERNFG